MNTTRYEINNDANWVVKNNNSTYCQKCGRPLTEYSLDRFCDRDCRKEYFAEINHDIRGFQGGSR